MSSSDTHIDCTQESSPFIQIFSVGRFVGGMCKSFSPLRGLRMSPEILELQATLSVCFSHAHKVICVQFLHTSAELVMYTN